MADETQVVEAAPVEGVTESQESATGEQQEPQAGETKPEGGFQKRIDRLTRANTLAKEEAEYWRQQALKIPAPTETQTTAPKGSGKPSENDYQTHAEFVEALTDWKVDQKLTASRSAERTESVKAKADKALQDFQAKESEFRSKTSDYDEVMEEAMSLKASDAVIAQVVESGPELKYYLAKNPDEVARLNKLGALALAKEVGKIEARFTTSQAEKPVKTTGAPTPPNPTTRSSSTAAKDPGDMSPKEYKEWFAKQNPNAR